MNDHDRNPAMARRRVLLQGLALATASLAGCGGGGGDSGGGTPTPPPPPPAPPASGKLVYRNSGVAAVYDLASRTELQFDPGVEPSLDPGVAVSRAGVVTVAREGDNTAFRFATYGLNGVLITPYRVPRDFAFQLSAVLFNADSTRIAVAVDEPTSSTNNTRIAKTLVYSWPAGLVLAEIPFMDEPVWAGTNGEFVARDERTSRLHLFSAAFADLGTPGNLVVPETVGAYNVSPDGRYIVWEDANLLRAYDRNTGQTWVAAEDATSDLHSPVISPDGNWVAVHARNLLNFAPHVFRFAPGLKVTVDSTLHALNVGLADTAGRMGWAS